MFHKLLFFVNILIVILFSTSLHSQETLSEIREGETNYQQGNYRKALTHFLKALELNPNSTKALIGYGDTSLALGSIQDANLSYTKALNLSPTNTQAIAGIGNVLTTLGKFQESRTYLEEKYKEHNNDSHILLALANLYEEMEKPDLAIYKLEKARQYHSMNLNLLERLGKLYIQQNRLDQSEKLSEEIKTNHPNSVIGYRLLGTTQTIRAYDSNPSSLSATEYFQSGLSAFQTALVIKKNDEDSTYGLVKLLIWKSEAEEKKILDLLYYLTHTYPEKVQYDYVLADFLSRKTNLNKDEIIIGTKSYEKILKHNDLDEIARFSAEEFSIAHLSQESKLRKSLGLYRLERYRSEKNSLHYKSALFHIWRAGDLIPNHPTTRNFLLETYRRNGNLPEFINTLRQIIKNDPGNFKAQNKLEYAVATSKKTLEYQEGFIYPSENGVSFKDPSTIPKILIMDFSPENKMSFKINSPRILQKALRLSSAKQPGIRLAGIREENQVRSMISNQKTSSFNPYHMSMGFDINESPNYPRDLRFIGIGKFTDRDRALQVEFRIYDRKTGKYSNPIRLHAKGRSSLAFLMTSITDKILDFLPKEGNILKVKKDGVIINLGSQNKINAKSKIGFFQNDRLIMKGDIIKLGDTISLVKPESLYWERELATGDEVRLIVDSGE